MGDSNRGSDTSKRKRQLSSSSEAEVSSSTSTSTTVTNEEGEDEEEEEEENEQVNDAIEDVVDNAHKRRRPSASNAPRHTLTKEKTPRLQLRSYPSTTKRTRGRVPQQTQRTTPPVTANHSATSDDEEEEEAEDEEETENEEEAQQQQQQPALKNKQKLRTPFRPPQHLRNKPCVSRDGGKTWTSIPWNKKHALPGGDAWIQPIKEFFRSARELETLKEEDRKQVPWRQDFEYCYGVHWPVRHLGAFMASGDVEASVSHRDTGKESKKRERGGANYDNNKKKILFAEKQKKSSSSEDSFYIIELRQKNKQLEEKLLNEKRTSASNANGVKKHSIRAEKKKPLDGEQGFGGNTPPLAKKRVLARELWRFLAAAANGTQKAKPPVAPLRVVPPCDPIAL